MDQGDVCHRGNLKKKNNKYEGWEKEVYNHKVRISRTKHLKKVTSNEWRMDPPILLRAQSNQNVNPVLRDTYHYAWPEIYKADQT